MKKEDVKNGMQFKDGLSEHIYTISEVNHESGMCVLSWERAGKKDDVLYALHTVAEYLTNGAWVLSPTNERMKAVITSVNSKGAVAHLTGLTFPIKEILNGNGKLMFALDVNGNTTDFTCGEITIVDFKQELQRAYNAKNWDSSSEVARVYNALEQYRQEKKIAWEPEYSCPA